MSAVRLLLSPRTTFFDRSDAGRRLGRHLARQGVDGEVLVLGLPRGGVPVACEVAAALGAPVDVLVVRKLGAPTNPELAVGSIAAGGVTVRNGAILRELGLAEAELAPIIARERREIARRERAYRGDRPVQDLTGKSAVLVDDGAATGATMEAAVAAARALGARRTIVALPTSSADAAERLSGVADEVVVLSTPEPYYGVGAWYEVFDQLSDADVTACLQRRGQPRVANEDGTFMVPE